MAATDNDSNLLDEEAFSEVVGMFYMPIDQLSYLYISYFNYNGSQL